MKKKKNLSDNAFSLADNVKSKSSLVTKDPFKPNYESVFNVNIYWLFLLCVIMCILNSNADWNLWLYYLHLGMTDILD